MNQAILPLSPDELSAAYKEFLASSIEDDWRAAFLSEVRFAQSLDKESFKLQKNQERLWSMENIAGAGQGRSVSVGNAIESSEFLTDLYRTCTLDLPNELEQRAGLLQSHCDRLLETLVQQGLTRVRPIAKLTRLLMVFFPGEFHTALNGGTARSIRRMIIGETNDAPIEAMVKCRDRLRIILGLENSDEERVDRAIFCWHLAETIAATRSNSGGMSPRPQPDSTLPELSLRPIANQRKGLTAVKGYVDTWRAVVNAAVGGGTPDNIVEGMSAYGLGDMTPKARLYVFNDVKNFEFLRFENGLWYPSDDGLRLIEEDPADVLIERFLVRTYGLAQLLRLIRENGSATRQKIYAALRAKYPNWKADFAQNSLILWAVSLGLIYLQGQDCRLTDYGEGWERRLPKHLPDPDVVSGSGTPLKQSDLSVFFDVAAESTKQRHAEPSFEALLNSVRAHGLVVDVPALRSIHVAWHCNPRKRFVLLSGLSGTGKTAILKAYAEAYCEYAQVDPSNHFALVPVAPDWRDPTGLLGYLNTLQDDPTWHREPTLSLLLEAESSPDEPFFLILDEMNLSHVEQYFAPFLSAMETGLPLTLHGEDAPVNGVPPSIRWPSNLFIAGTMNMDETTHRISDKVLDRAFTIEFWNVDLDGFFKQRKTAVPEHIENSLRELHGALKGIRRQFGYRTAGEIIDFCCHPAADEKTALDQAIYSKVLPRLRGDESPQFRDALKKVTALCPRDLFPNCADKLKEMSDRLETHGLAHYWS